MEETEVPREKHRLTLDHCELSHMLRSDFEPRQWWETASSQWQHLKSHGHQGMSLNRGDVRMVHVNSTDRYPIHFLFSAFF